MGSETRTDDGRFVADSFTKSFGENKVLKSASSWAASGRITLLIGRNGSGKTTLIRAAVGLIRAELGTVRWRGEVVLRPRLERLARLGVFLLPAKDGLSRRLRVRDHLKLMHDRFGDRLGIVERDPMEIRGLERQRIHQLSGGERRRLELTLCLMRAPDCLIADEPLIGLAPKHQRICTTEFRTLADRGCAVLVTGHEVEWLFELADDVHWIVAGGTYVLGSPQDAAEHQQFKREYLGRRKTHPPTAPE